VHILDTVTGTVGAAELQRDECLRLLAAGSVGRVVFTDSAMPAAYPVTYLLDGEEVVFRTAGGSKLALATLDHVVGFQADEIDLSGRTGWSVLGIGEAYRVIDRDRLLVLAVRMPPAWAPVAGDETIAVPLQLLTGRRLSAADPRPARPRSRR
jgi:hypothetical protein